MSTLLARWILDPVTSWQALHDVMKSRGTTSFDVAWRRRRVARFPDEASYLHHGHQPEETSVPPAPGSH